MHLDTLTKKEALQLGIIDADGLGFIKPQTAFKNITEQLIAEIKKGNLIWRQAWRSGVIIKGKTYGAQNYETQRPYTGSNAFFIHVKNLLNKTNYQFFLTPKQISERGGTIQKGAKPYPVSVFIKNKITKTVTRKGETFDITSEEKGVIWYHVYPIDLVDGLKPIIRKTHKPDTFNEIIVADADELIKYMPNAPLIKHGGDKAFYTPTHDFVQLPHKKAFTVQQNYYSVAFHELIHSTGHSKRLDRGNDTRNRDGSATDKKAYAFEELIAEIGAAFLCGVCEIEYYTINNSAAYLKGWSQSLQTEIKDDPNFLKRAVFKAVRAANFIIGTTLEKHGVIIKTGTKKPTEKHYPGQEIIPNKAVKASVNEAIKDLLTLPQYKGLSTMFLGMFYNDFKNNNTIENVNGALKAKMYEKFAGEFTEVLDFDSYTKPTGIDKATLSEKGKELIDKIKARIMTLKAKKSGTDLFPELAGVTDALFIFLNSVLGLDNNTVSREKLLFIINTLHTAVKKNSIPQYHPLRSLVNETQTKLVALINQLNPNDSIRLLISNRAEIETKINGLHGLGFWGFITRAVVGQAAKNLILKPKQALNGIEGFVRADKSETIKVPGTFRLKGDIGKLLLDIQPYKYSIVLTGDPHAGKTEVVMQLANAFAEAGKKVGAFMLEQGGLESKDTKAAIDRNITKENLQHVFITGEASKGITTVKENAKNFDVVIVDSWQKLGIPSTKFDELRHEFPNTIFIVIFQQNGEGGTRGGVSADYDTPVLLKVHKVDETFKNNYVEVKKNRGNSTTLSLKYMVKAKKTISKQ
jgi:antirestriction protein ArdC